MKIKITDLSDNELKRILKRRGYFSFGIICSSCFILTSIDIYSRSGDTSQVLKKLLPVIVFTVVVSLLAMISGLRRSFYLRTAQIEIENKNITILIKGKRKKYPISKFKTMEVIDSQDEIFSKSKRVFIILRSQGLLGLFKKHLLIRDLAHDKRELAIAELQNELNLPIKHLKYWNF